MLNGAYKAGFQSLTRFYRKWIPAFAGMTQKEKNQRSQIYLKESKFMKSATFLNGLFLPVAFAGAYMPFKSPCLSGKVIIPTNQYIASHVLIKTKNGFICDNRRTFCCLSLL